MSADHAPQARQPAAAEPARARGIVPSTEADSLLPPAQEGAGLARLQPARAKVGLPAAGLLSLQRRAGNRAVTELLHASVQRQTETEDLTAPAEPFTLEGQRISSYETAAVAVRWWCLFLLQERDDLRGADLFVPEDLQAAHDEGMAYVASWQGGGEEAFDRGNASDLRAWHARYVRAMNAARAEKARVAASRMQSAGDRLGGAQEQLEGDVVPQLRDVQREAFRAEDEDVLMRTADAIATVLDTSLAAKDAVTQTLEVASQLRATAGAVGTSRTLINVSQRVPAVLDALEKINKAYAAFQLARDGIAAIRGGATEAASARAGVSLMSTTVSAGGTLLGASAGFSLYANIYIGPMVSAILDLLGRLEDLLSRTENRRRIELGMFDSVRWQLEPGGRPMFDFMLTVMQAGDSSEVPAPPAAVQDYFLGREGAFSAGVGGGASNELPTTGWLLWEGVDESRIKSWVFRNRRNLWGMLYGDTAVPG